MYMQASGPADDAPIVLIVEDDVEIAGAIEDVIGALGYRSIWAADAREAFIALREQRPALMLVDLVGSMIGGADFLEVVKKCRNWRQIPRVFMTSADEPVVDIDDAYVLPKPIDTDVLAQLVRRHCQLNGTARSNERTM